MGAPLAKQHEQSQVEGKGEKVPEYVFGGGPEITIDRKSLPPLINLKDPPTSHHHSHWPSHHHHAKEPSTLRRDKKSVYDYELDIVLVGEGGCGKNSLLERFAGGNFEDTKMTQRVAPLRERSIDYKGWRINLKLWIFPRSGGNISEIYPRAHAVLICFDVSCMDNENTLHTLNSWHNTVRKDRSSSPSMQYLTLFLGCKIDWEPSLLNDPDWDDALSVLCGSKPCPENARCDFTMLPAEVIYQIIWFFLLLKGHDPSKSYYSYQPTAQRTTAKTELKALSARYERPVFLASAKLNVGVSELFYSVVDNIFKVYDVESERKAPNPKAKSNRSPYCFNVRKNNKF